MENRNCVEIIADILSVISKNDDQTIADVSESTELKPDLVASYSGLLDSGEYLLSSDGHTENDTQYSITEEGEKLFTLLEKESSWD